MQTTLFPKKETKEEELKRRFREAKAKEEAEYKKQTQKIQNTKKELIKQLEEAQKKLATLEGDE